MKTPIYLDYQATTPMDPRVLDAMMPYLTTKFGNPHSATHKFGWEGEAALDIAREQVSELIGAAPGDIIFTSGATEANNLAVKGVMGGYGTARPQIITLVSEHKCVLAAAEACRRSGYELTILPVEADGRLNLETLKNAVSERTALVSVMAVNNEIGVIQPLSEIGAIAHDCGALFHTDAAQAFGKIALDVDAMNIDMMSISGHKIYGPKGIGALYVRRGVKMQPQMDGGEQERGYRSGTQAPALVAGLGRAAEIASAEMATEQTRLASLMARFKAALIKNLDTITINGSETARLAGNLNISFEAIDGDMLLAGLRSLALSSGAACASAVEGPSYVLEAIGCSDAQIRSAIRIGIGRFTSEAEIDFAASEIIKTVKKLGGR